MKYYLESSETVLQQMESSAGGLSEQEAQSRLEQHGKNKLKEAKKVPLIKRFFAQLADPMIIILIVAAAVSGITAVYENESFADVFIILLSLIHILKVCSAGI